MYLGEKSSGFASCLGSVGRYMKMDMELAAVVEDDAFFADLSHRISLLITEDEHEDFPVKCPARVPVQAHCHASQPSPFFYEAAYMRESKGTGVFIPKSSLPKRKNRSGGRSKNNKAATTVPSNANATDKPHQ